MYVFFGSTCVLLELSVKRASICRAILRLFGAALGKNLISFIVIKVREKT
jgi:hypothetical protein